MLFLPAFQVIYNRPLSHGYPRHAQFAGAGRLKAETPGREASFQVTPPSRFPTTCPPKPEPGHPFGASEIHA